jgi:hypothetical protein
MQMNFLKVNLMPPVIVIWPSRLNQPAPDKAFVSSTASCNSAAQTPKLVAANLQSDDHSISQIAGRHL